MNVAISKIKKLISDTSCIRETHKEWLFQGKWLKVGCIHYTSQTGQERVWETVERTTTVSGVDGVDAIGKYTSYSPFFLASMVHRRNVWCIYIPCDHCPQMKIILFQFGARATILSLVVLMYVFVFVAFSENLKTIHVVAVYRPSVKWSVNQSISCALILCCSSHLHLATPTVMNKV